MKTVHISVGAFTIRPWLTVAGFLAIAYLLVSCGNSASGNTPDSLNREQATPTPSSESTTEEITTGESATGAGGATPVVVPAPDLGGLSREKAEDILASLTPAPTRTPNPNMQVGGNVGDLAAEVEGIIAWINSERLTIEELRGKVVLVDFWTYTCINCIRTFPFLELWHSRYTDDGLVILGIHAPEFEFEKNLDNVVQATRDNGIIWPVALDNYYVTWNNYSNQYWPAKYLIDQEGIVRYTHFGEGRYAETETKIRELLEEAGANLSNDAYGLPPDQSLDPMYRGDHLGVVTYTVPRPEVTRELYAGYNRGFDDLVVGGRGYVGQNEYYQNQGLVVNFKIPEVLFPHLIYFNGPWLVGTESVKHGRNSENDEDYLTIVYSARSVNAVLTSDSGEDYRVRVTMNGENLTADNKGADVTIGPDGESYISVTEPRMYNIVENPLYRQQQTLRMSSDSTDFSLFAFTFGVYQKAN